MNVDIELLQNDAIFIVDDGTRRTGWSERTPHGRLIRDYLLLTMLVDRLDDVPLAVPVEHQKFFALMVENFGKYAVR